MFNRSFIIIFLASLITIAFYSCDESVNITEGEFQTISGIISDQDGNPVTDALVSAHSEKSEIQSIIAEDSTDDAGRYSLEDIPMNDETVTIKVMKDGFETFEQSISDFLKNKDNNKEYPVILTPLDGGCCGEVNVEVTDEEGNTLNEVEVRLNMGVDTIDEKYTGQDGKVSFYELCEGNYWLRIFKEGYDVVEKEFEISECDTLNFEFALKVKEEQDTCCNSILKVQAKEGDGGAGIEGFEVKLWRDGNLIETLETNNDGWVIFDGLCEGKYGVSMHHNNYDNREFAVEFGCNEEKERIVEFEPKPCCDNVITVIPKNKDGEVLNGATVKLRQNGKVLEDATVKEGKAIIDGICKGAYDIFVQAEGYNAIEYEFEVDCGERKEIEKVLEQKDCCNNVFSLYVKDKESGEIISGATVKLWFDGVLKETLKTNEVGLVIFDGICKGKNGFSIQAEGYNGKEFNVDFDCSEEKQETIQLEKKDCCNNAIIVVPKNNEGEVLNGAVVKLRQNGKVLEEAVVKEGRAVIDGICRGEYDILIQAEGYQMVEHVFAVDCSEEKEIIKVLEHKDCCNNSFTVYVKDKETGENINGAVVILWRDGKAIADPRTENGMVTFKELCKGKYGFSIKAEGYNGKEFNVEFDCGEEKQETIQLEKKDCCNNAIIVIPKNEEGQILNGAVIKLRQNGKVLEEAVVKEGRAVIDGICKGAYDIVILAEGYNAIEHEFEVDCGEERRMEKVLTKRECCEGVIYVFPKDSESGEIINGAKINIWKNGKLIDSAYVGENGYAVLDNICEGEYWMDIIAEGWKNIEFRFEIGCNKEKEIVKELDKE